MSGAAAPISVGITAGSAAGEGAAAGAATGGSVAAGMEILGGPVGWAILAGTIIVGGIALYIAHEKSQEQLQDKPKDEVCADCGEVGCFNTPEGGDPAEMERQLKQQQDAINKLSPDEILDRLNKFDEQGRPNDSAERQAARESARQAAYGKALKDALARGVPPQAARAEAETAAEKALAGQDATHELDWVAGGGGAISGVGDKTINRSQGAQWNTRAPGSSATRRQELRAAAEAAKKAGKRKMDVKLKRC